MREAVSACRARRKSSSRAILPGGCSSAAALNLCASTASRSSKVVLCLIRRRSMARSSPNATPLQNTFSRRPGLSGTRQFNGWLGYFVDSDISEFRGNILAQTFSARRLWRVRRTTALDQEGHCSPFSSSSGLVLRTSAALPERIQSSISAC